MKRRIQLGGVSLGVAAAVATAAALASVDARAQERQDLLVSHHQSFESPQHFAAELRFMPYVPDIDSDPNLRSPPAGPAGTTTCNPSSATPYASVFGSSPRLMAQFEFDWQALRIPHVGTVGPGVAIGYTKMNANATFASPHNNTCQSGEDTALEIVPTYAVAVFRADVLWRELHIPFVPYVKAGIGYAFWRASNTLGTSHAQGVAGEGASVGTQLAIGVGLNLNVFDPYAAKNFDEAMGVNNTYLFGELMRSDLNGLGIQSSPLRVGESSWVAGLAFEF
jgi:hypothetical protein